MNQDELMSKKFAHVDDTVRLTVDVPEMYLHRGDMGVVCSTWFAPSTVYEVQFQHIGRNDPVRTLLLEEQVQVEQVEDGLSPDNQGT